MPTALTLSCTARHRNDVRDCALRRRATIRGARHRVEAINNAFRSSITEYNYQGKYRGVFPIKVNQLREVVEEILEAGKPFEFGLEEFS